MVTRCFAYIDPGSSNYLFQLLIAGVTTVVFFFSSIKRRIVRIFKKDTDPAPDVLPKARLNSSNEEKSKTQLISQ